jgi:hypothetical protein
MYVFSNAYGIRYSAHLLDLLALLGVQGTYSRQFATPTNPIPRYAPGASDRAETATLRRAFYELAANGYISTDAGWAPVNSAGPGKFVGVDVANDGATAVEGLRSEVCAYWAQAGFGPEFWWAD